MRLCSFVTVIASLVAGIIAVPCPAFAQRTEPARIVASIDDFVVHEEDLDAWWQDHEASAYLRVRQDVYDARRKALDALLGDHLLQREAAARKMTVENLLADELPRRALPVSDDEIRQMYERSLPLPGGMTFDAIKPMAVSYLQQQHLADARARYISALREAAHVTIRLDAPRQPVAIARADPSAGSPFAPIEFVEFADFECPYCRELEPVLAELRARYGDRLRMVWKDFPLPIHSQARGAAEAARCAADQGRFWEFHDTLFANQQALGPDDLMRHAKATALDLEQFGTCVAGGAHRSDVAADLEEGARQGVEATPTVFINGRVVIGEQPIDAYEKVIDEELR